MGTCSFQPPGFSDKNVEIRKKRKKRFFIRENIPNFAA
jgi:hypothetical protein